MANWFIHTVVVQAPAAECASVMDAFAQEFDCLPWNVDISAKDDGSTEVKYRAKSTPHFGPVEALSRITPESPVFVEWEELMTALAGVATFVNGECTEYEDKSEALRIELDAWYSAASN